MSDSKSASPIKFSTLLECSALNKPLARLESKLNKLTATCQGNMETDDDLDDYIASLTTSISDLLVKNYDLLVSTQYQKRKELIDLVSKNMKSLWSELEKHAESSRLEELNEQFSTLALLCDTDFNLKPLDFARSRYDCMTKWKDYEDQLVSIIQSLNESLGENNILVEELDVIKNARERIVIACFGSVKSTKSSVINFLLQEEVCPTADGAATARHTRITYGERREVTLITKQGQSKTIYCDCYDKLLEEASKHIALSPDERLQGCKDEVVIKVPIEELKGIELWDLPGFDENQALDNRVREIIHDADLIFALIPHRESLRKTFRDFVQQLLYDEKNDSIADQSNENKQAAKICFLVTQIDTFKVNNQTKKSLKDVLNDLFNTLKKELHLIFDTPNMESCDNFMPMCTQPRHQLKAFLECRKAFIAKSQSWFIKSAQHLQLLRLKYLMEVIQKLFDFGDAERITKRCAKVKTFFIEYYNTLIPGNCKRLSEMLNSCMYLVRQSIPDIVKSCDIKTLCRDPSASDKIDQIIQKKVTQKIYDVFEMEKVTMENFLQNTFKELASKLDLADAQLFEQLISEVSFSPYKQGIGYFDNAAVFGSRIFTLDIILGRIQARVESVPLLDYSSVNKLAFTFGTIVPFLFVRAVFSVTGKIAKSLHLGAESRLEAAVDACIQDFFQEATSRIVEIQTKYLQSQLNKILEKIAARENEIKFLSDGQKEIIKNFLEINRLSLGKLYLDLLVEQFKLNYPNFQLSNELLGQSNYEVFSATIQSSTKETVVCAAKKIPLKRFNLQEVRYLRRLEHPNIIRYHGVTRHSSHEDVFWIIMERMDGDLQKYLEEHQSTINEERVLKMFTEITAALLYIHRQDLIHRDIKPQNILYKMSGEQVSFYLADFGLLHRDPVTLCGSPGYTAPEIMDERLGPITNKTDVYSWGVTIKHLIASLPRNISQNSTKFAAWKAIADKCTNKLPEKRLSCEAIIMAYTNNIIRESD